MDYFLQFHWWYVPLGVVLLFLFFGKSKGGIVVKRFSANMQILDDRFQSCDPKADYSIFKKGKPDHIDIEIQRLTIPVGDELELYLNGEHFATVAVKPNKEVEFDPWGDEGVAFPKVDDGDELVVKYQGDDALKGTFKTTYTT